MSKQFPSPVTTIITRRVMPGHEADYEEWLAGINGASTKYTGSLGTTVLRPTEGQNEYVTIVQFDSTENLKRWMRSDERREWLEKLDRISLDSERISSLTGMERWFTLPGQAASQAPPNWKTAVLLILGLLPTIMLVDLLLLPTTSQYPWPTHVVVSLPLTVPIMVWVVMPLLTRLFFKWLYPEPPGRRPGAPEAP